MENNEIMKLLKADLFAEELPERSILNEIGVQANYFGDHTKDLMDDILHDQEAFENFAILASTAAIFMAYTWIQEERFSRCLHWDERKKASEEYCHLHLEDWKSVYKMFSGKEFQFRDSMTYEDFFRDVCLPRKSVIYWELSQFYREHSTIKQKMIGIFCRTLAKGGVKPEVFHSVGFPFI